MDRSLSCELTTAEAVEPILRFMESHPDVDYGAPGALVPFVEIFSGYEQKLVQLLERQPTPHTVGMLNRAINGKRHDPKKRQALLATLKRVLENPQADSMTRSRAFDYLEFQNAARQTFLNYPNNLPQGLAARTHLPCQKRKSPPCWRVVGRWSGFGVEL